MNEKLFQTSDLPTAAFLLSSPTIAFKGIVSKNTKTKLFLFEPEQNARKIAFEFINGKAMVNARLFSDSMRIAKDLVFGALRQDQER